MKVAIILITLGILLTIKARAIDIVSPSAGTPTGSSELPFFVPTMRYQQIYGASDFQSLPPGGGLVTEIWFRSSGPDFDGILPHVQITLSTTSKGVDGLSSSFAENIGMNEMVVATGALAFSDNSSGAVFPFTTRLALSQPFLYDPTAGNLLLDIRDYQGLNQVPFPPLRGLASFGSSLDTISSAWSFNVNGTVADQVDTGGLSTKFTITPVPEPTGLAILLLGLGGLCGVVFWRRGSGNFDIVYSDHRDLKRIIDRKK